MKNVQLSLCLVALSVSTLACGGDDGSRFDTLVDESAATADILCECFEEAGYDSVEDCVSDSFDPPSDAERECLEEAFAIDDTGPATVDCLIDATSTFNACLRADQDCADPSSTDGCQEDAFGDFLACVEMTSDEVNEAAEACES